MYCILFYKYHPLTSCPSTLEQYRLAHEKLCKALNLTGRILIGLSEEGEGINGTLAGGKDDLTVYVKCMLGKYYIGSNESCDESEKDKTRVKAASIFRAESKSFFEQINKSELIFSNEADFKWSSRSSKRNTSNSTCTTAQEDAWFPDLNIKLVKEIISTGGAFSHITNKDTNVGYLTPKEWHNEMKLLQKQQCESKQENNISDKDDVETVLIDVRNHKECQIGTFLPGVAIDPNTRTFSQFPKWVRDHSSAATIDNDGTHVNMEHGSSDSLDNKRILLYCTGGIRCEKASAYVRQMVPNNKGVYHLKGGIHKYLEEFGKSSDECAFVGKNFVFDRRGAMSEADCLDEETIDIKESKMSRIVGKCIYCNGPHDLFLPENICTVCRESVLVCSSCVATLREQQSTLRSLDKNAQQNLRVEFHCEDHYQMKSCYYTSLFGFSLDDLNGQIEQLQMHGSQFDGIGKKGRQKRRTIRKQIDKIRDFIKTRDGGKNILITDQSCRNCDSQTCAGDCWGFHGGNIRMLNKEKENEDTASTVMIETQTSTEEISKRRVRTTSNQRTAKRIKRQKEISEVNRLQLCMPPSKHRLLNGIRVPPPTIRVLSSPVKGKWCGKTLKFVMSTEFKEFANINWLNQVIKAGLIRINGVSVLKLARERTGSAANASSLLLSNMDTIERIVHWHEPPICVPTYISLKKHSIPELLNLNNSDNTVTPLLYCISKPASVPVHPAGPYYSNSLLMMVEAQENLTPKSLYPCHRIDRCTSGVLLCTNDRNVVRLIHGAMIGESGTIKKLYLAKVKGKFPASSSDGFDCSRLGASSDFTSYTWHDDVLEINAPVSVRLSGSDVSKEAEDASGMMHRAVSSDGKHAVSRFKFLSYDSTKNQSIVSCCPITGRGHQLRVHLEFINFPIHNDIEYGGDQNSESAKEEETRSVKAIINVSDTQSCLCDESVSDEEGKSAIAVCRCCNSGEEGVKMSFGSAQLLGGGHIIDLHAHRYLIRFKVKLGTSQHNENTVEMEFRAALPPWVSKDERQIIESMDWLK